MGFDIAMMQVFNGVSLFSILLLMSIGLAIVFGLMGVINMAHGELMALGAYMTYVAARGFERWAPEWMGIYLFVAIPFAFGVTFVFGYLLERGFIQRDAANRERGHFAGLLDQRGGIEADLTVTRLSETAYLAVVPGATLQRDLAWMRRHVGDAFAVITDMTAAESVLCLMGPRARHTILSAVPDALGARDAIDPGVDVEFPGDRAPPLHGKPGLARYRDLARFMRQFDLVLSYNWGSMDGVMAHRLYWHRWWYQMPPCLIHHEDGFNEDESVRRNWRRNLYRRYALRTAAGVVVPSTLLAGIAAVNVGIWTLPDDEGRSPAGPPPCTWAAPPMSGISA